MPLRDVILHDFWLKLIALVLAILTWFTVRSLQEDRPKPEFLSTTAENQTFHKIPVSVLSAADDPRNFRVKPADVAVTVRADPDVLRHVKARDIRAVVDLTDIESARGVRKRIDVSTPPGVVFIRAEPPDVEVVLPPKKGT